MPSIPLRAQGPGRILVAAVVLLVAGLVLLVAGLVLLLAGLGCWSGTPGSYSYFDTQHLQLLGSYLFW